MFEKVNPSHPDKIADRIAGAIVDLAYRVKEDPKIAVEVLIGHGKCMIIVESDVPDMFFGRNEIKAIVERISGEQFEVEDINLILVRQDGILAQNQKEKLRCGDNGIFKGVPTSVEEFNLSYFARDLYLPFPFDGKFIAFDNRLIICQSNLDDVDDDAFRHIVDRHGFLISAVNPLGDWTGGINVDSGATNRKLGSDMGRSVTGGGLHGKDLSKADVSVNIYAHLLAQATGKEVNLCCAIGDDAIDGKPYSEIVEIARDYINKLGGFEKFAEWGLI